MRLYFDATTGEPLVKSIRSVVRFHPEPQPEIIHIYEKFKRDIKDPIWIPQCRGKGNIIVSCDWGYRGEAKLPAICRENKITFVLMTPTLHRAKQFQKARAIFYVWPHILEAFNVNEGTRFHIVPIGSKCESFRFEEKQ